MNVDHVMRVDFKKRKWRLWNNVVIPYAKNVLAFIFRQKWMQVQKLYRLNVLTKNVDYLFHQKSSENIWSLQTSHDMTNS